MLKLPSFHGEGFEDGLFISVRGVSVLLVQLASFSSKPACLYISFDLAMCWNPLEGQVCQGCEVDQVSVHLPSIEPRFPRPSHTSDLTQF